MPQITNNTPVLGLETYHNEDHNLFVCCWSESIIWDVTMLMWRHCNNIGLFLPRPVAGAS